MFDFVELFYLGSLALLHFQCRNMYFESKLIFVKKVPASLARLYPTRFPVPPLSVSMLFVPFPSDSFITACRFYLCSVIFRLFRPFLADRFQSLMCSRIRNSHFSTLISDKNYSRRLTFWPIRERPLPLPGNFSTFRIIYVLVFSFE